MNEKERAVGLAQTANYQYAKQVGNQLFLAGQVPHDTDGELVGVGDARAQATQCLENLQKVIEVNDFQMDDLQQLTVYVVGEHQNLVIAWKAVEDWFADQVPPATLLGVADLGYVNQLVEIDATVIRASE